MHGLKVDLLNFSSHNSAIDIKKQSKTGLSATLYNYSSLEIDNRHSFQQVLPSIFSLPHIPDYTNFT